MKCMKFLYDETMYSVVIKELRISDISILHKFLDDYNFFTVDFTITMENLLEYISQYDKCLKVFTKTNDDNSFRFNDVFLKKREEDTRELFFTL